MLEFLRKNGFKSGKEPPLKNNIFNFKGFILVVNRVNVKVNP